MLLIDVSGSREFGTVSQLKKNLITEISAVLSFSAILNNDKIGVIFFSNKIEKFIPPQKGKKHILRIILELINFQPENRDTDFSEPLRYLTNAIKKRCTAFLISDYIFSSKVENLTHEINLSGFEEALKIANNKHDLVALKIFDKRETGIPKIGLVKMKDAESGKLLWIDTSSKLVRKKYSEWWKDCDQKLQETFKRCGVDSVSLCTDEDYVKPLINLFKRR